MRQTAWASALIIETSGNIAVNMQHYGCQTVAKVATSRVKAARQAETGHPWLLGVRVGLQPECEHRSLARYRGYADVATTPREADFLGAASGLSLGDVLISRHPSGLRISRHHALNAKALVEPADSAADPQTDDEEYGEANRGINRT